MIVLRPSWDSFSIEGKYEQFISICVIFGSVAALSKTHCIGMSWSHILVRSASSKSGFCRNRVWVIFISEFGEFMHFASPSV